MEHNGKKTKNTDILNTLVDTYRLTQSENDRNALADFASQEAFKISDRRWRHITSDWEDIAVDAAFKFISAIDTDRVKTDGNHPYNLLSRIVSTTGSDYLDKLKHHNPYKVESDFGSAHSTAQQLDDHPMSYCDHITSQKAYHDHLPSRIPDRPEDIAIANEFGERLSKLEEELKEDDVVLMALYPSAGIRTTAEALDLTEENTKKRALRLRNLIEKKSEDKAHQHEEDKKFCDAEVDREDSRLIKRLLSRNKHHDSSEHGR